VFVLLEEIESRLLGGKYCREMVVRDRNLVSEHPPVSDWFLSLCRETWRRRVDSRSIVQSDNPPPALNNVGIDVYFGNTGEIHFNDAVILLNNSELCHRVSLFGDESELYSVLAVLVLIGVDSDVTQSVALSRRVVFLGESRMELRRCVVLPS
jgi:hypothetical protein